MAVPVLADSLRSIEYFIAVAKTGSFTAAADELGISKSALGKSIAQLEQQLSTKLLHRTTRKLSLTTEGETYLASCESALNVLKAAELSPQLTTCPPCSVTILNPRCYTL